MKYSVTIEGHTFEVEIDRGTVRVDGEALPAEVEAVPGTSLRTLLLGSASWCWVVEGTSPGRWRLHGGGRTLEGEVLDERARAIRALLRSSAKPSGPKPLRAPMPGLVVKVEVAEGDRVERGQGLVVVEAMKMENELKAESPGRVIAVRVAPGDAVEKDQVLVELGPVEGTDG